MTAAGGPPVELGPAVEASWAADGRSIHLVSQDRRCRPTLTTMSVDGHVEEVVRTGLRSEDSAFAWSPDGRQVVFLRYHNGPPPKSCGSQGGTYDPETVVQDVIVMDADGTNQHVLVPHVWPSRPVSWSPDGTLIATAMPVAPIEANVSEAVLIQVQDGTQTTFASTRAEGMTSPRWSPDGSQLAFTFYLDGVKRIGLISVDGGTLRDLGSGDDYDHEPAWSPVGNAIAAAFDIAHPDGTIGPGDIVIHVADGSGRRDLGLMDVQTVSDPVAWSPDGTWLAYPRTAGENGGFGGVALVRVDDSARRELGDTAGAQWVAWQPVP